MSILIDSLPFPSFLSELESAVLSTVYPETDRQINHGAASAGCRRLKDLLFIYYISVTFQPLTVPFRDCNI